MSYVPLVMFGATATTNLPVYNNDPLTYCVNGQAFNHPFGQLALGQSSTPCQVYMATRCAQKWDGVCEYLSSGGANNDSYRTASLVTTQASTAGLSPGDILLVNTAQKKFLAAMLGPNCSLRTEQFDPINPSSPFISRYVGDCFPVYAVDAQTIDHDPVMNRILDRPWIATPFLTKLRASMERAGSLGSLKGTRLGRFYRVS